MATTAPTGKNAFDRVVTDRGLGIASGVMLAVVAVAVARGHADWDRISWHVWAHLALIATALALTPVMLIRPKGSRSHRVLGWVWASAMILTALSSLLIRDTNHGNFSLIHILSVWVLLQMPLLVWRARKHDVAGHRRGVRGIVFGALLIAGFFTFPFDRLLGHWLFA
ncbi:hypothetical protein KZX46_05005 [Polymorphobacter sp. PAMC 29334]|uniref:DUF2306 domain-containing protein n=1 Tax=Polymorphobacter sp. PAMC 29334 TaxID=2862331 RepID=UPI001C765778|nr:hypothetical protein [Polymorphobacter sp. PAMC 29334]QYE35347.1 hypothetical protein KZX46_05005 [Polymorphobacter sp. PAMC 29334]